MPAPTPSAPTPPAPSDARAAFRVAARACCSHPRCPRQHGVGLREVRRLIVALGRRRRAQPVRAAHTA
jgi:hypothetical protein